MDESLWSRLEIVGRRFTGTDALRLPHDGIHLFAKMEMANLAGSAKDRSAYRILREAVRRGEVNRRTTVVESSSGNFALSLAMLCNWIGIRFVPVIDPNVNASTEAALRRVCEQVEKVTATDATGGFLLSRLDRVSQVLDKLDDAYWPDQYSNPDAAMAHFHLTGAELVDSLPHIDYLFVGVGTGATIAGLSHRVHETCPRTTVVAVDVEGSAVFGLPPRRRLIPGLGSSIRPPMVDEALIDEVVVVTEWDEVLGCHTLFHDAGIRAGGSTGGVYAAINRYFEGHCGSPPLVAFLCVDRGEAYAETIYDQAWVAAHFGHTREVALFPCPAAGASR